MYRSLKERVCAASDYYASCPEYFSLSLVRLLRLQTLLPVEGGYCAGSRISMPVSSSPLVQDLVSWLDGVMEKEKILAPNYVCVVKPVAKMQKGESF